MLKRSKFQKKFTKLQIPVTSSKSIFTPYQKYLGGSREVLVEQSLPRLDIGASNFVAIRKNNWNSLLQLRFSFALEADVKFQVRNLPYFKLYIWTFIRQQTYVFYLFLVLFQSQPLTAVRLYYLENAPCFQKHWSKEETLVVLELRCFNDSITN